MPLATATQAVSCSIFDFANDHLLNQSPFRQWSASILSRLAHCLALLKCGPLGKASLGWPSQVLSIAWIAFVSHGVLSWHVPDCFGQGLAEVVDRQDNTGSFAGRLMHVGIPPKVICTLAP